MRLQTYRRVLNGLRDTWSWLDLRVTVARLPWRLYMGPVAVEIT